MDAFDFQAQKRRKVRISDAGKIVQKSAENRLNSQHSSKKRGWPDQDGRQTRNDRQAIPHPVPVIPNMMIAIKKRSLISGSVSTGFGCGFFQTSPSSERHRSDIR
jgi:hypothetical protein